MINEEDKDENMKAKAKKIFQKRNKIDENRQSKTDVKFNEKEYLFFF